MPRAGLDGGSSDSAGGPDLENSAKATEGPQRPGKISYKETELAAGRDQDDLVGGELCSQFASRVEQPGIEADGLVFQVEDSHAGVDFFKNVNLDEGSESGLHCPTRGHAGQTNTHLRKE